MSGLGLLRERALALDAAGLAEALAALEADDRAAARDWALRDKTFFEDVRRAEPDYQDRARYGSAPWLRVMCLVALCPPAEAARAIAWRDIWDHMIPEAREHTARLVAGQPRTWAETFLTATAQTRLSKGDARHAGACVAWLVDRGLADHDLPCPDGATFLEYHLHDGWRSNVTAAELRGDRLLPDLIYLMIRRGYAGNLAALHEAVPELVADGSLDRVLLVDACLEVLTVESRVGSQRVVARVLDALHVQPEEIPGGLSFLTGVIATRDGSVGQVLQPLALALVEDEDGLIELTRVIAGRKERKQKRVLLAGLREPDLRSRVGTASVLAALETLAAGQDDSSLLGAIDAARVELGASGSAAEQEQQPVGLWGLDLDPGPERTWPWWVGPGRYGWNRFLDRRLDPYAPATEYTVDLFVRDLVRDGPEPLRTLCQRLRVAGNLSVGRLIRLVEPAFLAGGLRTLYPVVLRIADDIASGGRILAGLPDLLRLLTRYAAEVPGGLALPPHLARWAADQGTTKTQVEARALQTALTRDGTTSGNTDDPVAPSGRGLWTLRPPTPALPRLLEPSYPHRIPLRDSDLPYYLALGPGGRERTMQSVALRDAQVVDSLAIATQLSTVEDVRRRVAAAQRLPGTDGGPTSAAIRLWQDGALTTETYADVLAAARPSTPSLDHLVFAWTCEQLVRLPTHPGLLCAPDRTDGVVVPERLATAARCFAGIATVGPLDLVLTLTRLQMTDPESARAASRRLDGLELWTDPTVTRTSDETGSVDVIPLLRARLDGDDSAAERVLRLGLAAAVTPEDLTGPASDEDVLRRVWPLHPTLEVPFPPSTYADARLLVLEHGRLPSEAWKRLVTETFNPNAVMAESALAHLAALGRYPGVLDPVVTVPPTLALLDAGQLPLNKFVDGVQWMFERGGMPALWPLALAVAAAAVGRSPKPNGLPFLLTSLTTYAVEVPPEHRAAPAELVDFAAAAGRSKSHEAARQLVAALGDGPSPS